MKTIIAIAKTVIKNLIPLGYVLACTFLPLKCKKRRNLSKEQISDRVDFARNVLGIKTPVFVQEHSVILDTSGNPSYFLEGFFRNGIVEHLPSPCDYILFHEITHKWQWDNGLEEFNYHPWALAAMSDNAPAYKIYIGRIIYWLTDFELEVIYVGYKLANLFRKYDGDALKAKAKFKNRFKY